jgi:hypothetical protein
MATTKITSPELFDLGSLDTALKLPSGTTAERPTSPSTGEWRYNTTTNLVEFWDGGAWRDLQSEDIPAVPSENFNVVLYDGTSATHAITGVGFQPDLVWIKDRSNGEQHILNDSTRGASNDLSSNTTAAQANRPTGFVSFDSDGFTLGTDGGGVVNDSARGPYVAWCWKVNGGTTSSNTDGTITSTVQANTKAGFSIVQYTGNGTAGSTIGHGLSEAPDIILVKATSTAYDWQLFSKEVSTATYPTLNGRLALNSPAAGIFDSYTVSVGASTFEWTGLASTFEYFNQNNITYIAYCFAEKAGYSKFGTYTGNGSAAGPIVTTGFEPAFIITKRTDSADNWSITDNKRSTSNPRVNALFPNLVQAELTGGYSVSYLSNGFQIATAGAGVNANGGTFLYIAFAADPSAAPVLADSFNTNLYTGNGTSQAVTGLGFSPSFTWIKQRDAVRGQNWYDVLRGPNNILFSNTTGAQDTTSTEALQSFNTDGFSLGNLSAVNASGGEYVSWNWKANPVPSINTDGTIQSVVSANPAAGFSIVGYTGNGLAGATIGHGLGNAPSMYIVKDRDTVSNWRIYHSSLGATKALEFNTNSASTNIILWNNTEPTSSVFSLGTFSDVNANTKNFIAYCFAEVAGFSKFGSYSGTGSSGNSVNLGFQPDWVMMKAYNTTSDWFVVDSVRDGNPHSKNLRPNNNNAEATAASGLNFTSTGWTFTGAAFNDSGVDWIYMAFKENPGTPAAIPAGEVAYLVVAAGGGAGGVGGGGGAGGLRTSYGNYTGGGIGAESNITLSAQTYTITIGAGGTASATGGAFNNDGNTGSNGTSSVFGTITSLGGGGGTGDGNTALSGGSGGGCRFGSPGSGTYGQGFYGATGDIGGGGGGAGGTGLSSTAGSCGANGGPGLNVPITGTTTYYAGGGAGGVSFASGCSASSGGIGGGGDAGANAGTANTGGGGGGGSWTNNANYTTQGGGNGGSGVVILRMNTSDYSGATTGSPTVTTNGSETILTYTGSGTYVHS